MLSYQSLMPVGAGTPMYEKPELWLSTANWHGGFRHAPPRPLRGTSPRATFSHSAFGHRLVYNSRGSARGEPASRFIGGHIFVPMTRREILVSVGNDIVGDGSRWRGRTNPSAYRGTEPVNAQFKHPGSANVAMV